jgi:hypothetical protein
LPKDICKNFNNFPIAEYGKKSNIENPTNQGQIQSKSSILPMLREFQYIAT